MGRVYEIAIIGGGPAGLTAALYAGRAGLDAVLLEGTCPGGQVMNLDIVENYPGFEQVSGAELASQMMGQAMKAGMEMKLAEVRRIELRQDRKLIITDSDELAAKTVIIAGGASHVKLGVPGEAEGAGRFVFYCATCDGPRFRGKELAVVGGGDTAVTDALFLSKFSGQVTVIHRRDKLRATKVLQDRAFAEPKLALRWNTVVEGIEGSADGATVRLRDVISGEPSDLSVAGVFVGVGLRPNTQYLEGLLALGPNGEIPVDANLETAVPGIYAAGDVRANSPRQIVSAAGDGAAAVASAARFLMQGA